MTRLRLLLTALFVATIIAVMHILATIHHWYWYWWWLDLYMHFGGGFLIGLFSGGYAFGILQKQGEHKHRLLFWTVLPVLAVGVLWEFFEVAIGIPRDTNYTLDTTLDLLMDTLGGVAVAVFLLALCWKRLKKTWKR